MESYKITTQTYTGAIEKWFATKAEAKRYLVSQVALGYYPTTQLVSADCKTYKTVHFPSVAVKAFFSGVNF